MVEFHCYEVFGYIIYSLESKGTYIEPRGIPLIRSTQSQYAESVFVFGEQKRRESCLKNVNFLYQDRELLALQE